MKLPGYCRILRGPREPWSAVARFRTECLRLAPISAVYVEGKKNCTSTDVTSVELLEGNLGRRDVVAIRMDLIMCG